MNAHTHTQTRSLVAKAKSSKAKMEDDTSLLNQLQQKAASSDVGDEQVCVFICNTCIYIYIYIHIYMSMSIRVVQKRRLPLQMCATSRCEYMCIYNTCMYICVSICVVQSRRLPLPMWTTSRCVYMCMYNMYVLPSLQ